MGYNYPHFDSPFFQGLYNWQTAIGAGIALAGAGLLWRQVQTAERHEAERQRRRFVAARATLPYILSEVFIYLESAMEWMSASHADAGQSIPLTDPPSFPLVIIASLERMIEATSVDQAAKACINLLRELQIFRSRIQSAARANRKSDNTRVGVHLDLEDHMVHAAEIHRRVELLYPFARERGDQVPEQNAETSLFKSLTLLGCGELAFKGVFQRANEIDKERQTHPVTELPAAAES